MFNPFRHVCDPATEPELWRPRPAVWIVDDTDVTPAPGGHMMVFTTWDGESNFITWAHLDAEGVLGPPQVYDDNLDDYYTARPRLNARGERIFMTYSASLGEDDEEFEIRLTEFGCTD